MSQGQLFFQGKKLNLGPAVRKEAPDTPDEQRGDSRFQKDHRYHKKVRHTARHYIENQHILH